MGKKVFLLADGAPLPRPLRDRLRKGRFTIAVDGAAETARRERWLPNLISGDFDTVSPKTLAHFARKGVPIVHAPDQNHTDLEKALTWCVTSRASSVWVAQAIGHRLDHSLANLIFLKRFYSPEREILYFTGTETVRFARDQSLTLRGPKGRGFALIPFPFCRASSTGLEYELDQRAFKLGENESVSNRAKRATIHLAIEGEALLIEETQ